ncbi:hypothetical protein GCM10023082_57300 [Streptomyces tremellae]|uniref:Uncharacterized protein n=1 Tax=Streptomyces tremellae TaxID=1124239 RepID=A0ABP7G8B6_9ACTN
MEAPRATTAPGESAFRTPSPARKLVSVFVCAPLSTAAPLWSPGAVKLVTFAVWCQVDVALCGT